LVFTGAISSRLQVTNSKSGVSIGNFSEGGMLTADSIVSTSAAKREITLVDVPSTDSPGKPAKRKRVATAAPRGSTPTSSTPTAAVGSVSAATEVVAGLTCPMLRLLSIPPEVAATDILNTLFSGLSVVSMYICLPGARLSEQPSVGAVDAYIEFTSIAGAELGLQRDGEQLIYKCPSTATAAASSSSNTRRRCIVPELEAVEQDVAMFVRHGALRVSALTEQIGKALGARSTFRDHVESAVDLLQELADPASNDADSRGVVLLDPLELADTWQPVVAQMMLPAGAVDAYSADNHTRVHIVKDTSYLFTNPAVDDVLLPTQFWMSATDMVTVSSIEDADQAGREDEGLYHNDQDVLRCRFQPFMVRAERVLKTVMERYSLLQGPRETTPAGDGAARKRYLLDMLNRQLRLYRVLYKTAWDLSITYCVFKE
jgi:hypothetical protein